VYECTCGGGGGGGVGTQPIVESSIDAEADITKTHKPTVKIFLEIILYSP
jgi:hypothetical protein